MTEGKQGIGARFALASRTRAIRLGLAVLTVGLGGLVPLAGAMQSTTAYASSGGNANAGDVWVDNVGQPAGPGHEMDPHLACANINLWGNGLADSSGTFTIDGWPPSGSQEQTYAATWTYNTTTGGDQVIQVINVATLVANARAAGDAPINKQGLHFKLQFSQDPQKHKTFWVNCPAAPTTTTLWVQKIRSCGTTLPGAQLELVDATGKVISGPATSASGTNHTFADPNGCPTQEGSCTTLTTACLTLAVPVPATGTATYTILEVTEPVGFVNCIENFNHDNPVSQCSKQWGTVTVNSSGALKVTFTSVSLTGQTLTLPTDDTNTGNAFWLGTQADPALFYDDSQKG
jgi:hypothetical protein